MADNEKKINLRDWIIKITLAGVALGAVFWYSSSQSITMSNIVQVIAQTPLGVIVAIEIIDRLFDKSDYTRIYDKLTTSFTDTTQKYAVAIVVLALVYCGIVWVLSGSLTLAVGAIDASILVVAGLYSIYILAPETGDDELIFMLWMGATIATRGSYITLLPIIPGLTQ